MTQFGKQFESLPKRNLVRISERLIDDGGIDFRNPYDYYDNFFDLLKEISPMFGIKLIDYEDIEFMSKFIVINDNQLSKIFSKDISKEEKSSLIEGLVIPKLKKFNIEYRVVGSATVIESYETTTSSYDEELAKQQVRYGYDQGEFDYWEGENVHTDTSDFESHDFIIDEIYETKSYTTESNKIIDTLDKKTLLELKQIIDKKLLTL